MSSILDGQICAGLGLPDDWPPQEACTLFEVAHDEGLLGAVVMPDKSLLFQIATEEAGQYRLLDQVKTCKLDPVGNNNFVLSVEWKHGKFTKVRINGQQIFQSEPLKIRQADFPLSGTGAATYDLDKGFPIGVGDKESRCAREAATHEMATNRQTMNILHAHLRDARDRLSRAIEAVSRGDRSAFQDIAARLRDMACGSPKPFGLLAKCAGVLKVELLVFIANNQDPFPLDHEGEESFVLLLPTAFAEPFNGYGRPVDYERWREFNFANSSSSAMTVRDFIWEFANQLGSHVDLNLSEKVRTFVKVDGGGYFQLGLAMSALMMLGRLHLALSDQLLAEFEERKS